MVQNVVSKAAKDEIQQKPYDAAPIIEQKPTVEDHPEKVEEAQSVQSSNTKEKDDIVVMEKLPEPELEKRQSEEEKFKVIIEEKKQVEERAEKEEQKEET